MRLFTPVTYLLATICTIYGCQNANKPANTSSGVISSVSTDTSVSHPPIPVKQLNRDQAGSLKKAGVLFKHGRYDEAIKIYDLLIQQEPDNSFFYSSRASGYYSKGFLDRAKRDCDKALELDPQNHYALYLRAEILINFNNFQPAINDLTAAINTKHDYALAYNLRGVAYGNIGDMQHALQDLTQSIKLNASDPSSYYNRALVYSRLNMPDSEIKDYEMALKIFGGYIEARNNLGLMKEKYQHDYNGAIKEFSTIIKMDPVNAKAYYCRANCKTDIKDYNGALTDYNKAIAIKPDYKLALEHRADVYDQIGNKTKAQADRTIASHLH